MKKLKINAFKQVVTLFILALLAINLSGQHRTLSQVDNELTTAGYTSTTVPSGCSLEFSGATVYYYTQTGISDAVYVYHYPAEEDVPSEANNECTLQAHSEYDPDKQKTIEICAGAGNECKNVIKTDDCGNHAMVIICCG